MDPNAKPATHVVLAVQCGSCETQQDQPVVVRTQEDGFDSGSFQCSKCNASKVSIRMEDFVSQGNKLKITTKTNCASCQAPQQLGVVFVKNNGGVTGGVFKCPHCSTMNGLRLDEATFDLLKGSPDQGVHQLKSELKVTKYFWATYPGWKLCLCLPCVLTSICFVHFASACTAE
eukprot:TRINITY_DN10989_c0_g1_i1.p1 TRINITY_DN10989_c0_g1~~TRINITY_DN10989_c0_g1_i1.p1  ORF type:complete len:174 (+),score=26.36 TRINITY_DN10989_c0_g1_i1:214-735(+)